MLAGNPAETHYGCDTSCGPATGSHDSPPATPQTTALDVDANYCSVPEVAYRSAVLTVSVGKQRAADAQTLTQPRKQRSPAGSDAAYRVRYGHIRLVACEWRSR